MKEVFGLFFITLTHCLQAQQLYTLPDLIALAQQNNSTVKIANTNKQLALLQYNNYLLQNKPSLLLNGNIPVYDKDNFSVRQPDGTIKFLNRSQINSNVSIGFIKPITATGGTVSVNTSLNRFDDLIGKNKTYNGTPVYIQLQQPLFAYNNLKWQKKIEPLKLANASLQNQAVNYKLAYDVTNQFFNIASINLAIAVLQEKINYNKANTNAETRKQELGKGDKEKLLQLKIQMVSQAQQMATLHMQMENALLQLNNLTALNLSEPNILMPQNFLLFNKTTAMLMDSIKKNNKDINNFALVKQELLAEKERLTKEKTTINVLVSYGLNQSGNAFRNVYTNANDQQRFNVGFSVPLADWGRRKNATAQVKAREHLLQLQEQQQINDVAIEVATSLNNLKLLQQNYSTTITLDSLATEQYKFSNQLFLNGKTTFLELQAANLQSETYKRQAFDLVKEYYLLFYKLQQICACNLST